MPDFKDFTFPSCTGKNNIRARILIPGGKPRGIVQIAHGIAEHIGRYEDFMRSLGENGFIAVGNDHLGHGLSARNESELGFFAETRGWNCVVGDMDRLHGIVKSKYPGLKYIFFGHSMGSFLTRTYIIAYPEKPDLTILCGTGHQHKPAVEAGKLIADAAVKLYGAHKVGKLLNDIAFGSYVKGYDDVRTPYDWLSRDNAAVDNYIADPLCGFIPTVGLFSDMMHGLSFITDPVRLAAMKKSLPVLFIAGDEDPVGENGAGVARACGAFVNAGMHDVSMKLYRGARHELLNELNREEVTNDILTWLSAKGL